MIEYRPLPDYWTIKDSDIDGLGLFAIEDISKDTTIGVTHHFLWEGVARTPLGGFINHSNEPNCILDRIIAESHLRTTSNIKAGEEITLSYEMYSVDEKS